MKTAVTLSLSLYLIVLLPFLNAAQATEGQHPETITYSKSARSALEAGDLAKALSDIDRAYLLPGNENLAPTLIISNILFIDKIGKTASGADAESAIKKLSSTVKTPQAKFSIYCAWAAYVRKEREKKPSIKDIENSISANKGALRMLEASLDFGDIGKEEYDRKKAALDAEKETLAEQLENVKKERTPTEYFDKTLSYIFDDASITPSVRDFAKTAIASEYKRVLNSVRATEDEKKRAATRILSLFAKESPSYVERTSFFAADASLDAMLTLGKAGDAIVLADFMLLLNRCAEGSGRAEVLYRKGNALLLLNRTSEAREIAAELAAMNIKTNPLSSRINSFLYACRKAEKQ